MYVYKWQQKCISTIENESIEKLKPSSNCVVETILEFHKMTTMDLEDLEDLENFEDLEDEMLNCENSSNISWYSPPSPHHTKYKILFCSIFLFYFIFFLVIISRTNQKILDFILFIFSKLKLDIL